MTIATTPASNDTRPILYRGHAYREPKRFWRGTQRSISPAETLERIRPHFPKFGITRLANITGLDYLGVPVTLAIRPNADTLSQGSGKGFSLEAALTSGAMEAIELFHAEEPDLPTFQLAYEQLPATRMAVEDLPFTKHHLFRTWWPYRWTMGWDLINQEEVPVPWWLIHMGKHPLRRRDLHTFQVTSNGLASGNNFLEAVNAGIFEVIERDAVACNRVAWAEIKRAPPLVDQRTISQPLVLDLIDRLARAQVRILLFDCTNDIGVPVYMTYLYDTANSVVGVYRGYGAHLDPEVAMIRAITEAVQARLIYIAGSRDDVFRHNYLRLKKSDDSFLRAAMNSMEPTTRGRGRGSDVTDSFEGDTQCALDKLKAVGLNRAIVVELTRPGLPIHVIKVIVPGLEGYMFDFYEPGRRARAFIQRRLDEGSHLPRPVASPD